MAKIKGYGQYCPIARAAEILTERWVPLVVRELCCGSTRFNQLQSGVPRMSSALLSARLKELEYAGIVERKPAKKGRGSEYHVTDAGMALFPILESMGVWAQQWMRDDLVVDQNLDPDLLMWDIRRTVSESEAPVSDRFVTQFQFSGVPVNRRRYWILFENGDVELCIKDPGFEPDLYVSSHIKDMVSVWLGHAPLDRALRDGTITLDGNRSDVRKFRDWFSLSFFAPAARAALMKN
jgi:DNA-binding HxlR family transcriptional regulator